MKIIIKRHQNITHILTMDFKMSKQLEAKSNSIQYKDNDQIFYDMYATMKIVAKPGCEIIYVLNYPVFRY